jgi:2-aminoadipate transaminase
MDYAALYSQRARIGLEQGGAGAQPPTDDAISFAFGLPDPGSFPNDELRAVNEAVLANQSMTALQYGNPHGEPRLRAYLADRLNEREGLSLSSDQIAITSGSLQAIALLTELLVDPGDTILLEGPTFLGAARIFRLHGAQFEELPIDNQGLVISELERCLERLKAQGVRPKFLYTMPTFHNPAGVTMPLDRRLELLKVARQWSLLIIEDDAYGDLRFEGSELPSLLALDGTGPGEAEGDGLVVRLGTFSKTLAAGLRLGWAAGPRGVVQSLAVVKTDGGTSPYAAHLAAEWATSGKLEPHVQKLRRIYGGRRDAMLASLERHCAPYCSWTSPQGGFFVWVELNDSLDPELLRETAEELGVVYLPGSRCFASGTGDRFLRLAFSLQTPERIEEGIGRLGQAMKRSDHRPLTTDDAEVAYHRPNPS